jgi:hypothetical protein
LRKQYFTALELNCILVAVIELVKWNYMTPTSLLLGSGINRACLVVIADTHDASSEAATSPFLPERSQRWGGGEWSMLPWRRESAALVGAGRSLGRHPTGVLLSRNGPIGAQRSAIFDGRGRFRGWGLILNGIPGEGVIYDPLWPFLLNCLLVGREGEELWGGLDDGKWKFFFPIYVFLFELYFFFFLS